MNTFTPAAEFGYAVGSVPHNYATLVYLPRRNKARVYVRKDVRPLKLQMPPPIAANLVDPIFNDDNSCTFPDFPLQVPLQVDLSLEQLSNDALLCDAKDDSQESSYTLGDMSTSHYSLWNNTLLPQEGIRVSSEVPLASEGTTSAKSSRSHHLPSHLKDYEVKTVEGECVLDSWDVNSVT